MKKHLTLFLTLLMCAGTAVQAQSWIDVTKEYITNPGFDNNSNAGWEYYYYGSTQVNCEAMEFWQATFDVYQTVAIPNGRYRVSVQAYFRAKDNNQGYREYQNGKETITGVLYANDKETPLVSIYTEYLNNPVDGCWGSSDGRYYPNTMSSGTYMFMQGYYNNSIEAQVTDGQLTFGLRNNAWVANNWCLFDNFKLEYYGTLTHVSDIILEPNTLDMITGAKKQLAYTLLPNDATIKSVVWKSDNTKVATVDAQGNVQAVGEGTAHITLSATDGGGAMGTCTVNVSSNQATAASLIINELQASNIDMFIDPSYNYGSWVELYNPTDQDAGLTGFYLSDDPSNLLKHRLHNDIGIIPAHGFKTIWFDHNEADPRQVSFKLDCDGGILYISNEQGTPIAVQSYPAAISRTSYARTTDGGSTWGVTALPSPGRSNSASTFASQRLDPPVVDTPSRLFTSSLTVKVDIPVGTTLRYTTDGTAPVATSEQSANGIFNISSTTLLRLRLFAEDKLPSAVVTRSYIYETRQITLPVISVVTDPRHLYDDSLGVMVKGVNGRPGNGQSTPCNWNMEWDRPVNFEYLSPEGEMLINQETDLAMAGGWSRAWLPHSFKIKAAKVYEGVNYLGYPFFADKPYLKHKTLQIRNGGNDNYCRIKDAALQSIISTSGIDIDYQAYQPVVHYLNGEYIGLINMREPNNKHFAYANYGYDDEEIDQFEMSPDSGYVQKCGTKEVFRQWYDLSANAANADTYAQIKEMVDIDEYINYMATEFYLCGADWPQNNIKGYRPRIEGGKFRFVIFDLDGTFQLSSPFTTFANKQNYTFDKLYGQPVDRITAEIEMVTIFLNMLNNQEFRKQFIDSYCLIAGSVFEPTRCSSIIDSLTARVADMMAYENKSPYSTANSLKSNLTTSHQTSLINTLKSYGKMQLNSSSQLTATLSSDNAQARLLLNGLPVPTGKFSGTLFAPAVVKAEAPAGYRFEGWMIPSQNNDADYLIPLGSQWEYYDQGSLDAQDWTATTISTTGWGKGLAPLGYYTSDSNNGRGYQTFLDYGTDSNNKRPTYYFRTTAYLSQAPANGETFTLEYTVDDGFIIYVNGQEAARYNMPSGTVYYNTYASTYASGNPDHGTLQLPASLFVKGTNTIAVEVHNNDGKSTDIYWEAALIRNNATTYELASTNPEYELEAGQTYQLVASYQPADSEEAASQHPVCINEISADNSIYINDTFKKNDWVELYNNTDQPVDVAGMYLSDNALVPAKYQITAAPGTASTVIAPHGYMVIWCDKLTPVNQLHASFKLDKDGGEVLLTAADRSWTDRITYGLHTGTESVGRYPDGTAQVYQMIKPTLCAPNMLNSYAQWVEQPEPDDPTSLQQATATGALQLAYNGRELVITGSDEDAHLQVGIHTVAAQTVYQAAATLDGGQAIIALPALPRGVYIINANTGSHQATLKVVVE